jgi:chemotaxis protein MotA
MMRLDLLSIIGVVIGFAAILGGNFMEGGSVSSLLNLPAFLIVFGGTFGAAALQTPMATLKKSLARFSWIFTAHDVPFADGIKRVVRWAVTARKEGLLGLESISDAEKDVFARKGLQLLVDGNEPEAIRKVLEMDSYLREQRDVDSAKFYESMGGYSPTIGIIGAVMGLIHVMGNLADPSQLGAGIAVAFVATIYGVAFANLFLLPIAGKLRQRAKLEAQYREMMIEGLISIAEGENPKSIELKLTGFVHK